MPRGPKGVKRPADVIGNAVCVMRIATGEIAENPSEGREGASTRIDCRATSRDCPNGSKRAVEKIALSCFVVEAFRDFQFLNVFLEIERHLKRLLGRMFRIVVVNLRAG